MGITPLLSGYALLMVVIAIRGSCLGFSQVLMISILGRALNPNTQGKGVGLRTTTNRIMNTALPPVVGAFVEFAGLENAFYIVGSIGVVMMVLLFVNAWRHKAFQTTP